MFKQEGERVNEFMDLGGDREKTLQSFTHLTDTHHSLMRLDERPAKSIHFGVQPTSIAEIVTSSIPSPQGGLVGATVDTFPALREILQKLCGGEGQRGWVSLEVMQSLS